ncbi:MAG: DUF3368 domain-containing protein [Phycisphaerae bacterium]|nr:DUF3368 domain-containing protein [Phycisphaerae bacterium]
MPAVSNTSPILNLAIIGRLSLLRHQFSQIIVPPAVVSELRLDQDLPGVPEVASAFQDKWIRVQDVADRCLVQSLIRDLDEGEAEAIALACQTSAPWVLLDEREGRQAAKSLGLRMTGTVGVLLRAYRERRISSLQKELENLRNMAGFHLSDALFCEVLRRAGENP